MPILMPRDPVSGDRLNLVVSAADAAKIKRGLDWEADVMDLASGYRYRLKGLACNVEGCNCDSQVLFKMEPLGRKSG